MSAAIPPPAFHVMTKPIGALCNLNCEYCFYLSKQALYAGERFRMSDEVLEATLAMRAFLFDAVYENDAATAEFKKATGILGGLWEKVRERPDEFLDPRIVGAEGVDAAARDFLAGMTDRFAVALYEQLFIPKPWIGPIASNRL